MACTELAIDALTIAACKKSPRKTSRTRGPVDRPIDDAIRADFEAMATSIREELAPLGTIETICVDRAIVAAWRLREAVAVERVGIMSNDGSDGSRETDRAERSLRRVLDSLNDLRRAAGSRWGRAEHPAAVVDPEATISVPSNEWPVVPIDDAPLPRWQDRLVFDFNVSNESPVVRGTWITVAQIVSLIVDGQTWADILRSHPELSEDDLRVCLSYATERENDDSRGLYLP